MDLIFKARLYLNNQYDHIELRRSVDHEVVENWLMVRLIGCHPLDRLPNLWQNGRNDTHNGYVGLLKMNLAVREFARKLRDERFSMAEVMDDDNTSYLIGHISTRENENVNFEKKLGIWIVEFGELPGFIEESLESGLQGRNADLLRELNEERKTMGIVLRSYFGSDFLREVDRLCFVCMKRNADIGLVPCGHITCSQCARYMMLYKSKCYTCGKLIYGRQKFIL